MKKVGDTGELEAISFLKNKGYTIVDTNFKFGKIGEVDIVCKCGQLTVFVEVKNRRSCLFGYPEESLSQSKKIKILKTIQYYCLLRKISLEHVRFDFISIYNGEVSHYENVELF